MPQPVPYESEESLVESFLALVSSEAGPWGALRTHREFDYGRGRTDVIAITSSGMVVAFEAKLSRWRKALHQAYRNRCFADSSYVVLPKKIALRAARFLAEFDRRGVGICYVCSTDGLVVVCDSAASEPIQPWLRAIAADRMREHVGS